MTNLAAAAPRFHSLTGTQPVGQTQIAAVAEYTGTITSVKRVNERYWSVVTRETAGAFSFPKLGAACAIWFDATECRYVVDYYDGAVSVEADRTRSLGAAIGVATSVTARRWSESR
jgi:hypothetical protein